MTQGTKQLSPRKLALLMVAALALIWLLQPAVSEWLRDEKNGNKATQRTLNPNQTESPWNGSPTIPSLIPGTDPFKAHLEKNGPSPSPLTQPSAGSQSNSSSANSTGSDPFKAFLDQQKQLNKEVRVSPFGK